MLGRNHHTTNDQKMEKNEVLLGQRDIDKRFPFERARKKYTQETSKYVKFILTSKMFFKAVRFPHNMHVRPPTKHQKEATKIVFDMIEAWKLGENKLFFLSGVGGSGKTQCFHRFCTVLDQNDIAYNVVSPTAVNTAAIGATTIHFFAGWFSVRKKWEYLVNEFVFPSVSERIKKTKFLLIDEIGMVGVMMFVSLLRRIWKVKCKTPPDTLTIGNLPVSIIAAGDFAQLGVVQDYGLDTPIHDHYSSDVKTGLEIFSQAHYKYELKTNIRQSDDIVYQRILQHIREDKIDEDDLVALETRLEENVSDAELSSFFHSIHIYSTNVLCDLWNQHYLIQQDIPIKLIKPEITIDCSLCAKDYRPSYLGTGVNVFITRNLFVAASLCNGTSCVVEDLYFDKTTNKLLFITVRKPVGYIGPVLEEDGTVPIAVLKETSFWLHRKKRFTATYLPIVNAQGISTFKAQGRTINPLVACFDGYRLTDKKSIYSSLSRCGSLANLIISSQVPLRDFFRHRKNMHM